MEIWHILQLDFTVESKANLAPDFMVMQEKSRAFGGLRGPPTPGVLHSLAYGLRPQACLQPSTIFSYFLQSLVASLYMLVVLRCDIYLSATQLTHVFECYLHVT